MFSKDHMHKARETAAFDYGFETTDDCYQAFSCGVLWTIDVLSHFTEHAAQAVPPAKQPAHMVECITNLKRIHAELATDNNEDKGEPI
jgi:hypothetical protein